MIQMLKQHQQQDSLHRVVSVIPIVYCSYASTWKKARKDQSILKPMYNRNQVQLTAPSIDQTRSHSLKGVRSILNCFFPLVTRFTQRAKKFKKRKASWQGDLALIHLMNLQQSQFLQ
jgi:hypothetical protein